MGQIWLDHSGYAAGINGLGLVCACWWESSTFKGFQNRDWAIWDFPSFIFNESVNAMRRGSAASIIFLSISLTSKELSVLTVQERQELAFLRNLWEWICFKLQSLILQLAVLCRPVIQTIIMWKKLFSGKCGIVAAGYQRGRIINKMRCHFCRTQFKMPRLQTYIIPFFLH